MGAGCCDHNHLIEDKSRIFIALAINFFVIPLEIWGGITSGSFALLSDGIHMISHLGLLLLAFFAEREKKYEFYSIFFNSMFLMRLAMYILVCALWKFSSPFEILSGRMLWVASVGLTADLVQVVLIYPASKDHSKNMMSVFAHTFSDASLSLAVVIGAVCIHLWGISRIDAIVLTLFFPLILGWSLKLTKEALGCLDKK